MSVASEHRAELQRWLPSLRRKPTASIEFHVLDPCLVIKGNPKERLPLLGDHYFENPPPPLANSASNLALGSARRVKIPGQLHSACGRSCQHVPKSCSLLLCGFHRTTTHSRHKTQYCAVGLHASQCFLVWSQPSRCTRARADVWACSVECQLLQILGLESTRSS